MKLNSRYLMNINFLILYSSYKSSFNWFEEIPIRDTYSGKLSILLATFFMTCLQ